MNDIKLALLYQKIDNNSVLNDPTETIYYGARIKDPDLGIHYTFIKSPNGDIGLLRTENTDQVLEDISNLVEVCVNEVKDSPVKLTFLLKWNSDDNITTWGDSITNEFLLEFEKSMDKKFKIVAPIYTVDKKKYKLSPFTSDENIAISFKLTEGRDILYLKEAIPELFRKIYNEELINIDNIDNLFKKSFLDMDLLKANDSRQDSDVVKSAITSLRSQAIRKNIEDWIEANIQLFQNKYYKYEINTMQHSENTKCYILLESKNNLDEPIIISEIRLENALMYVKHTLSGYPLETQIRYATKNQLEYTEQLNNHTFIMMGSQSGFIYSSSPNLIVKIVRIAEGSKSRYMVKQDAIISEVIHNKELVFQQGGRFYTFNITGTPAKKAEVGRLRDFIWRMATKGGWGAGWGISNTDALKQDRDLGDACNTRTIIPLNISIDELKQFETLNIYIDDWYGVASGGGSGGIHYYSDYTGRMCYQGYAVYANNEASIPNSKLNIPLIMNDESQAQAAHLKLKFDMNFFKWDGSWNRIYNAPTGIHGLSVSQTRRKNRLLGGFNFRYYLRIRDNKYLELLCEYTQNADGDKHDNCYTQGAGRIGVYIAGFKPNSMRINILDYFTREIVYSYPATDIKVTSPALQIVDTEKNYLAYLGLDETPVNGFKIYDTNLNKTYYAKEILMNKSQYKYDKILIDDFKETPRIPISSKQVEIDGTIYVSKFKMYEFEKTEDRSINMMYYSPSEEKYYIYDEENQEFIPVEYEDYIKENEITANIVDATPETLNLTESSKARLITRHLNTKEYEIQTLISKVIDELYQLPISFKIPIFNENEVQRLNLNNQIIIEFVLENGYLHTYYKNADNEKYVVDINYNINCKNEVNE